jgi:hypothetical protein
MKKSSVVWGLVLIFIGGLLLFDNIFDVSLFSMARLWPMFILGLGLIFELSFFASDNRKDPGLLVPGGILTTLGVVFFFQTYTNWYFMKYSWPFFILAVAIGLFQLYWFSGRPKPLLIPIFILSTVAVVSFSIVVLHGFMSFINFSLLAPVALIIIGILVLFGKNESKTY